MKIFKSSGFFIAALLAIFISLSFADSVKFEEQKDDGKQVFRLSNHQVECSVIFESGKLISDRLETQSPWVLKFGTQPFVIETDANFALDVVWTGWRAPGKVNNAENPTILTKQNFKLERHDVRELPDGVIELDLYLKGMSNPFELLLTYQLEEKAFYARRNVAVRDAESGRHFLQWIWPRRGFVFGDVKVLKPGGFGQPVALQNKEGGSFFGLEYPTSENSLKQNKDGRIYIRCGQERGEQIGSSWIESEWVVEGLSPNSHIKLWFWKYLDSIRVAPLKPYLLYNTWYDVRAPEIVKNPAHVMNEETVLRIIELFQKEMVERRGLKLDTFVLDDGWDIYRSDWVLSKEQFPRGLSPIIEALEEMGTDLGIWLGPIGGYSNRDRRVGWMGEQGYEIVKGQLCLAGEKYRDLFKKRVLDFVLDGVSYYKWDGIQFSCSEPDHGHPVGVYSRRAVMESVIDLCQSVRAANPGIFLNITSGTWLSPWWVKYANTIWMQGYDYGYSVVPSISRRDRAITYRDYVLYDDLTENDFWFPIANLMTHGIIKGNLQKLGGEAEPLDKFTDNALLYFARGVSMWELYISPDLLTDGEWNALAKSIKWAKDRVEVLRSTEMIGGDPGKREAYGYAHFWKKNGIVVARNPYIQPQTLKVTLSPSLGHEPKASSLVVERVYPSRWISPRLYAAGQSLEIPLQGYETAVYEIYPVEEASEPLLAGVTYELVEEGEGNYVLKFYDAQKGVRLLNPSKVISAKYRGKTIKPSELTIADKNIPIPVSHGSVKLSPGKKHPEIEIKFDLHKPAEEAALAILLEPVGELKEENEPDVTFFLDGKKLEAKVEQQKGSWAWHVLNVRTGKHTSRITIKTAEYKQRWTGKVSAWLICSLKPKGIEISFDLAQKPTRHRPMPPRPWPSGTIHKNVKLGEVKVR
jgi:uncharacterized protein (DUF2249 family)